MLFLMSSNARSHGEVVRENFVYLALIAAGSAILAWSSGHVSWSDGGAWLYVVAFVGFSIPLLLAQVTLAPHQRHYSMDDVAIYAIVFTNGSHASPHWAIGVWIMFVASVCCETVLLVQTTRRRGWDVRWRLVFHNFTNPFARVTYLATAGIVYEHVNAGAAFFGSWHNLLAIAVTVAAYMVFTSAVDAVETWTRGERLRNLLDAYAVLSLHIAMLAPLGVVLAVLWLHYPLSALLLAVPLAVMHRSMKAVRGIVDEAQHAIETMMSALEQRDTYTAGHSERVGRFAAILAGALGLSEEEVRRVRNAGRIHDIGKIDIPDAILRKTCCLNHHEYGVMRTHTDRPKAYAEKYPRLGRHIPFHLAACHHERYDGRGYVYGLRGDNVPLGARILSVADTWDAMTSDRPYRTGLADDEALLRLVSAAGTQFDPLVVEAFQRAYECGAISRVMIEWKETERLRQALRHAEGRSARTTRSVA